MPSAFVAAHWQNVRKPISDIVEQPASHTVEVEFPIGVSKIMEYVGEKLDKRLVFDPQMLEILHLQEKDMLIFQCDESEENNMLLRVSACHSIFDMAMIDTRLDRAVNCFLQQIPLEYRVYIDSIFDVLPDGNCGYYCILSETKGVSGVPKTVKELRESVYNELRSNYDLYKLALGIENEVQIMEFEENIERVLIPDSWMEVSECFTISTVLSIPILVLVPGGTCIYIPQRDPPEGAKGPMICIAHVNGNHFVRVSLKYYLLFVLLFIYY